MFGQGPVRDLAKKESEYYKILEVPIPKEVVLEVGRFGLYRDDKLGVSTKKG